MCVCVCVCARVCVRARARWGRAMESDVDNWTPLGIMRGHTFEMNKEKCSKLKQNIHLNLLSIQRIKKLFGF